MFKKIFVALALCLLTAFAADAQKVYGVITDRTDGSPLPGVAVFVEGGTVSAVSTLDGEYEIAAAKGTVLVFSCVGMTTERITVEKSGELNVTMATDIQSLSDAIVVAYGTTKKESFTGSAEVVTDKKIKERSASDVTKLLDGQVSGVMMTSGSGQPGSGASMVIRGFGSINASNSPLIVVDGVPYDGDLNAISSSDIKSVSVLKDASAGALYGARGANGVILITTDNTKTGEDKISVEFGARAGVIARAIPFYETMSAKQYMEHMYSVAYNDLVYVEGYLPADATAKAPATLSKLILGNNDIYNIFDKDVSQLFDENGKIVSDAVQKYDESWMDEAAAPMPLRQEYRFAVRGGGEKSRYLASLSYVDENGTLKTTGFKRYTVRVEADFKPKEWMDFGASVNYAYTKTDFLGAEGSSNSNIWYSAMMMAPIYPVYQRDAEGYPVLENGNKVFDYGSSRPAGAQNNRNCVATLFDDDYYNLSDNFSTRVHFGIHKFGFNLTTNLGVDNVNAYETTNYNIYNGNAAGTGRLLKENSRMMSYTWNQLLTYNKSFGEHSLDAMAGHEFYSYNLRYLMGEKTGFSFPVYDELGLGSTIANSTSAAENYAIDSFLGRVNYNYKDKYYLSASARTDGSSRFKKENRWGFFWSLGASWRISQEPFLASCKWLDNLTLKASYGIQGNDNLGSYYAWQSLYNMYYSNGSYSAGIIGSIENPDVTWEKNGNFNTGIEFKMKQRFSGTIEWYSRKTSDLLLERPMPISLGFPGYNSNIGSIVNSGFDISLSGDVISTKDFGWNLSLIASTLKNKVLKLTGESNDDIISGVYIIKEGEEINSFYMSKSAGVDPTTGEQLYWAYKKDANGNMVEGSEYITNDPTAAASSKYIQGSRIPDVYGSLTSSLRYRNFDLSAMMTYSLGGKIYDSVYMSLMQPSFVGQTYHVNALRSWSGAGDITDVPRANSNLSSQVTDRFLVNASYIAIKSITLGYTFKEKLMKKLGIESARAFLTADSPWLFTHMKGMDPQASFSGSTSYTYTPNKSLTLGVDLKF